MGLWEIILIAIGLSMDAFAVSIAAGCAADRATVRRAILTGVFFGVFQALMPIIGWALGVAFESFVTAFDHWIAFGLLAFIGGKMLYEARKSAKEGDDAGERKDPFRLANLLALSIATSIDALAVGFSFAMLDVVVWRPAIVIGVTTFSFSVAGVLLGSRAKKIFGNTIEVIGGLILIGIGAKIVIDHVFFAGETSL